ncbi:MAG: TVP38/TMEM64 family protein [Desulfovibrio sp.]|jgi:uncharacterized membrane protein YdjX (TVP38/TMEM64 family)|nr:TVP38/TMEM64 family protein [Desulfovibrio sp.]
MTDKQPLTDTSPAASPFSTARRLVLVVLFIVLAGLAWRLWDQNLLSSSGVIEAVRTYPLLAPLAFIGLYALTMLFLLPTLPLNLGAGFLWGAGLGALYSLLGSSLGCILAFVFARTAFGQPFARGFNSPLLQRISGSLERSPWKAVAFVRLNPAVPTSVVNFLLGLTSLKLWTYAWGTLLFSAPLCYVFSYLGQQTGGFMLDGDTSRLVRLVAVTLGFGLFLLAGKHVLSRGKKQGAAPDVEEPRP